MRSDIGSNYLLALAESHGAKTAAEAGASVDGVKGTGVCWLILVTALGTDGTGTFKAQYSDDDFSSDTNDDTTPVVRTAAGVAVASNLINAAGLYYMDVPNPKARYSRIYCTPAVSITYAVIAVHGPKRYHEPTS